MRRENYFTAKNKTEKVAEWLTLLSGYYSSKRKLPFEPEKAALLIIDMQEFFTAANAPAFLPAAETIIPEIRRLKEYFLKHHRPVILTKFYLKREQQEPPNIMIKWWGKTLFEDNPFVEIDPRIADEKALTLYKPMYDAFYQTTLENILKENNIRQVILTGVATHLCVETTARSAFVRNFTVFLPVDAIASYTEEMHLNTLKAAAHGFGIPVSTNDLVEKSVK
ncbi:MAG: cysteine hydrolase [Candidatus Heimdallarchaeota archaeon]|nr:cysteine hydrolase [Candidatus Heimdallarchaeota archaeon]